MARAHWFTRSEQGTSTKLIASKNVYLLRISGWEGEVFENPYMRHGKYPDKKVAVVHGKTSKKAKARGMSVLIGSDFDAVIDNICNDE